MEKKFNDPLDEIIERHKIVEQGGTPEPPKETPQIESVPPVPEKILLPEDEVPEIIPTQIADGPIINDDDEINYGDDDQEAEMAEEERQLEAERKRQVEEAAAKRAAEVKTLMPPEHYDSKHQIESMDFQTDKLAIVTTMVNKVTAKYRLIEGGIPDYGPQGEPVRVRMMGELMDCYHEDGEVITPKFESIILNSWVMPSGETAAQWVANPDRKLSDDGTKTDGEISHVVDPEATARAAADVTPTININVPEGTPVTVNVDEEVVRTMTEAKKIDVVVREVSEEELKATTVIENSQQDGIIGVYDSGINDVPITLPASAYRCVMRSINWFDFIKLVAPTSQNRSDDELKKWSVIYQHMKQPSIGEFKDFDDFLKKTKYQDRELLMWAILVATADEEENLALTCANPKCRSRIDLKYRPRTIIHLDPENIPPFYNQVHDVSPGKEALELYNQVSGKRRRYQLPHTGIIVEINEPSAHEFITVKLKLIQELYNRFIPDGDISQLNPEDPAMAMFDYLSANALYISAMTIIKDGKEYRYTNWADIEKIITKSLDADDSGILLKLIQKSRANVSPVTFFIENVNCPRCHQHEDRIPINDIGNTLLFQVSRRLDNTEINLIEMD